MKTTESQSTLMNVEETDKQNSSNDQLVEHIAIRTDQGKTPFTASRMEDKWFITIGKYRVPNHFTSYDELVDHVENNLWEMVGLFITVVVEENNQINKEQK